MVELIQQALSKGAKIYSSISGGKDGQAMTKSLHNWGFPIEGLIHADLGRVEWKESLPMCQKQSKELNIPLFIVKRKDGLGLLEYWKRRMHLLQGSEKPFWSSSKARYCTSDLKRGPINAFFTSTKNNFIISCEGIRAEESPARAKKEPLTIRSNSSNFYKGMTVEQAITNFNPKKKLVLTWYPIFNFTLDEVWNTYNTTHWALCNFREHYVKSNGYINSLWPFHPAYVRGNDRVSCKICILGSLNDIQNGAREDPELLNEMITMEEYSGFTFKQNWSLKTLQNEFT
jgi:3'-phosphoadenosine 5'-phosphosulfate sulfotransferase (PAPS reductase)/FAD synthetase